MAGISKLKIYFVDLDATVVEPGTTNLLPGVKEKLEEMSKTGQVWFFSCWAFGPESVAFLKTLGIPFGCISKPYADEYVYIDDKLVVEECRKAL